MKKVTKIPPSTSTIKQYLEQLTSELRVKVSAFQSETNKTEKDRKREEIKAFINDKWWSLSDKCYDENWVSYIVPKKEIQKYLLSSIWKDHVYCVYCEQSNNGDLHIDHIKPKQTEDYFELAFSWDNFLPACIHCNRNKSSQFDSTKYLDPSSPTYEDFDFHFRYADDSDKILYPGEIRIPYPTIIGRTDKWIYMEELLWLNKKWINEHTAFSKRSGMYTKAKEYLIENWDSEHSRMMIKLFFRWDCESFTNWLISDDPNSPLHSELY